MEAEPFFIGPGTHHGAVRDNCRQHAHGGGVDRASDVHLLVTAFAFVKLCEDEDAKVFS